MEVRSAGLLALSEAARSFLHVIESDLAELCPVNCHHFPWKVVAHTYVSQHHMAIA